MPDRLASIPLISPGNLRSISGSGVIASASHAVTQPELAVVGRSRGGEKLEPPYLYTLVLNVWSCVLFSSAECAASLRATKQKRAAADRALGERRVLLVRDVKVAVQRADRRGARRLGQSERPSCTQSAICPPRATAA